MSKLICQSLGGDIKVNSGFSKGNEISISFRLSDKSEAHSSCTILLGDKFQSINQFFKNNEELQNNLLNQNNILN